MFKKINWWFIAILGFVLLLRVPSWFEPHWYGDEEIYLAMAQAMRRGAVLYRDIWDNKTPLLYLIYAVSPTLLWAKLTATACVLGTALGVYKLSQRLLEDKTTYYALLPSALTGVLLSLPSFEGTIANAELYFTLPIILGAILVYRLLTGDFRVQTASWIGILAAVAFLLKVPAVFDFVGLMLAFSLVKLLDETLSPTRSFGRLLAQQVKTYLPLVLSFAVPVGLVFLYFLVNNGLSDFVTAAFKQNANYVAIDSGLFQKLTNPLYVKGAILFLGVMLTIWAYWKRLVSKELVFLISWFGFSLYGALLSNRPYTHYLLQMVPPLIILTVYLAVHLRRYWQWLAAVFVVLCIVFWQFRGAFALDIGSYNRNFFAWASEQKSWEDYINYFDYRTGNDYLVAQFIADNSKTNDPIFVWGDVASIYTISNRPAATKFIQAHHLTTINPSNFGLIIGRLDKYQPKFIIVTRPVIFNFADLEIFLGKNYKEVKIVGNMYVYQNTAPITPPAWSPNY